MLHAKEASQGGVRGALLQLRLRESRECQVLQSMRSIALVTMPRVRSTE